MIAFLSGKILSSKGDSLVIDVSGVGYEVLASRQVLASAEKLGAPIEVVVYTDVRENAISLFGFADTLEREVFLLLKKVKGVGSRLALGIISAIGPTKLLACIGTSDVSELVKIPGIGKKTAERLVVELREQVGELASESSISLANQIEQSLSPVSERGAGEPSWESPYASDAAVALEKLGFSQDRARQAVSSALDSKSTREIADAGELVKLALNHLS